MRHHVTLGFCVFWRAAYFRRMETLGRFWYTIDHVVWNCFLMIGRVLFLPCYRQTDVEM